ncbi:MAG: universal stress protein [Chloroflexi bacterium]|nr:universal stress protein [Chloroflexota bacterium]MBV9602018.1 universal stress protein [Chloroflexota bacterium]
MSDDGLPRTRTILVALDLTPAGEVKIPVAEEYARALDADVLLLHVLRPGDIDPATVSSTEAQARTYLDTFGARLRGAGIHAEGVIRSGAISGIIIEEALIRDVFLIILGTNTRRVLSRAVLGSVADQVARAAPCPVMLVHPQGDKLERQQLRCFHQDAERAGVLVQRDLGVRTIEVARIVGSVDRCLELGLDFRPPERRRRRQDEQRFDHVRRAVDAGTGMPLIEVYKLGFGYYVLDGHHRVAAALERGQIEIDAHVVEYVPFADAEASERFAARHAFEHTTGLTEVGASHPATYTVLLEAIERFRAEQHLDDLQRAARRWFMEIYRPLWEAVRARQLTAAFPGDRSADLIARLASWREDEAPDLDWPTALDRFVDAQTPTGNSSASSRNG